VSTTKELPNSSGCNYHERIGRCELVREPFLLTGVFEWQFNRGVYPEVL